MLHKPEYKTLHLVTKGWELFQEVYFIVVCIYIRRSPLITNGSLTDEMIGDTLILIIHR